MLNAGSMIKRSRLLLYGKTEKNEKIFLGVPGKFTLKKDIGAASLMTAVIRVSERMERLTYVSAECDGEVLFIGIPDEEIYTYKSSGIYLKIVARCNISLLIDNEVMPQEIKNPSLAFFSRKFLEPLGFRIKSAYKKGYGELKAKKGSSIYALMENYFRAIYKTSPVIKDDGSIYLLSEYTPDTMYIDESKLIKAEITRKSCDIITEYILPDSFTGAYNVSLKNPDYKGFERKKYRENPGEVDFDIYNDVKITTEGFIKADIYDVAECFDERGVIESIRYDRDASGDITTLMFKSREL